MKWEIAPAFDGGGHRLYWKCAILNKSGADVFLPRIIFDESIAALIVEAHNKCFQENKNEQERNN